MARCMMCWPDRVPGATLSGGSWQSGAGIANIQSSVLSQYARSTDATTASTQWKMVFDKKRYISAAALVKHNLSLTATARLVLYSDAAWTNATYDSGFQPVWNRWFPTMSLRWGDSNFWTGKPTLEFIQSLDSPLYAQTLGMTGSLATTVPARSAKWFINDTGNATGYIQLGRLFMAEDWTPAHNFSYGSSLAWVDPSLKDTAMDGSEVFDLRTKYRERIFTLNYMTPAEGVTQALAMCQQLGISGELLYIDDPDPQNSFLFQQTSFIARLEELSPLQRSFFNNDSMAFKLKEVVSS